MKEMIKVPSLTTEQKKRNRDIFRAFSNTKGRSVRVGQLLSNNESSSIESCTSESNIPNRKVAKVEIMFPKNSWCRYIYRALIGKHYVCSDDTYSSRRTAIRGAKRFCDNIGYECEIVKC